MVQVPNSMSEHTCEEEVEQNRWKYTTLPHAFGNDRRIRKFPIRENNTSHVIMKKVDVVDDNSEYFSVDCIEWLGQIY